MNLPIDPSSLSHIESVLAASMSGLLIALAWLWFWLREDASHPEPRRLIALAFASGMAIVLPVVGLELYVQNFLVAEGLLYIAWSSIEEVAKYAVARITVLWRKEDDEPIDPVIYMVTTALGFAGVENALFLMSPISGSTVLETIQNGDMRFVGATLVHVLASSIIGIALGVSMDKPKWVHGLYVFFGVILAASLHSAFNLSILNASPARMMEVFLVIWMLVIVLLAILEWVKRLRPRQLQTP